jgi:two-component system sensor histidine kinase PilS (NtrC family)
MSWFRGGESEKAVIGRGSIPTAKELLRWVYLGRMTLAIVVFLAAAFYFQAVPPATLVILAIAAIAAVLVSGFSVWHTHIRQRHPGQTFLYSQALFDLALVTVVVHVTEGPDSQFPALYIVVIAISSLLMPLRSSLLVTAMASLLYVADIVWWQPVSLTAAVWLQVAVFVGVFAATGWIASRVQAVGAEREELRQEVDRLKLEASDILGNLHSGVVTVDGLGNLLYVNPSALELLDLRGGELRRSPAAEVLGMRSPELWKVIAETQLRRVKTMRAEGTVRTNEREFPIGVTTTAFDADSDGPSTVSAIFTDISDQKRIEGLRLRTERLEAVAELSASLAHEIKNPLASIRSSVEQLSGSARGSEDELSLASLVLKESDRLSGLLSEFLDFSRVRVTHCRRVDLADVVEEVLKLVRKHPDCGDEISLQAIGESVVIEGDEDLLHRVVSNLVLNAVQASSNGIHVTVETRKAMSEEVPSGFQTGDVALLRVSDDGPGIPHDLQDRLFEPFVTGRVGGSGLGLPIVQRAVLAHKGMVFVDSAPGEDTTFSVFIPVNRNAEAVT